MTPPAEPDFRDRMERLALAIACLDNDAARSTFRHCAAMFPTASIFWNADEWTAELVGDDVSIVVSTPPPEKPQ